MSDAGFRYVKNGEPMVAEEEQLFDCLLIAPENVGNYPGPVTLTQ
jgi:erythritol transport system substrate-binding protein